MIICHKTLKTAYCDRLIFDTSDALALALCFLRTNSSANSRQRTAFCNNLIRFFKLALSNFLNKSRNIYLNGTTVSAKRIFTIKASFRFIYSHFFRITESNLIKIFISYIRFLARHRISVRSHIRHYYSTSFLKRLHDSSLSKGLYIAALSIASSKSTR